MQANGTRGWMLACLVAAVVVVVGGCSGPPPLRYDQVGTEDIQSEIDASLPAWMADHHIEGLSIAVVKDGDTSFITSHGTSGLDAVALSDETVFEAASLGKPVFAHLLMAMAEDGLLDLDEPLSTYQTNEPIDDFGSITARMILSHTSGLADLDSADPRGPNAEPGTAFRYSSSGYRTLQTIVEELTGRSLDDLADEFVFGPAAMTSSSFVWHDDYEERLARGHRDDGSAVEPTRTTDANAASSLYTTPADYASFVAYSLRPGPGRNVTDLMLDPAFTITDEISWGSGWGLQATEPNRSLWHWGSNPGYRSWIVGYPDEQLAIVVLSNSEGMFRIVDDIVALTIGGALPAYDWF